MLLRLLPVVVVVVVAVVVDLVAVAAVVVVVVLVVVQVAGVALSIVPPPVLIDIAIMKREMSTTENILLQPIPAISESLVAVVVTQKFFRSTLTYRPQGLRNGNADFAST